jgi:phosphate binding protein
MRRNSTMLKKLIQAAAVSLLLVPMVLQAQDATPEATESVAAIELPAVDPLVVEGDIVAAGSSTVYPLAEAIATKFTDEGFAGNLTIDSIGSGAGIQRFCNGETDIANASRAIHDDEIANCQAIGREPIEFRIGTDALTVAVSRDNDFVQNLTTEQLAQIYSGEAATWADVDPSWPAEPIQLFSPGTDSGTFDYFVEHVFQNGRGLDADAGEAAILNASGIQLSEDDNVLVQGVEGSPYAIGYFGFAYYQENEDLLRAVAVDGVMPDAETAEGGTYPMARPLFMYSAPSILQEKPQVADFISYALTNVDDVIDAVGYFPASTAALNEAKAHVLIALGQEDLVPADVLAAIQAEAAAEATPAS